MHASRDGSSVHSGPVSPDAAEPNPDQPFVRDRTAFFEWTDTGALILRQARDEVHLSAVQVQALLVFLADASAATDEGAVGG